MSDSYISLRTPSLTGESRAGMFVGFCIRIAQHDNTDSLIVYILTTLFLLLSPCAFLATNYVLLTRLAQALDANSALFIRASLIVKIFVGADVFTFFLQASGGGLSATEGNADIGHTVRQAHAIV